MASLVCGLCENEGAVLMYTVIENGDVLNVGKSCLSGFALGQAASLTEDMTPELCEAYGAQFDAIAAHDLRKPARAADTATTQGSSANAADGAGYASTTGAGDHDDHEDQYEDGNTKYGMDDADELNDILAAESSTDGAS